LNTLIVRMRRMSVMSNYLCSRGKHRRSGGWYPANSSAPSCVVAKNSALMLSACTQYARTDTYVEFFQRGFPATGLC